MPWVKLTDDFPKNIKVIAAGLEARALYVTALCHCNENLTDGFISEKFLHSLGMITGLADYKSSAERLVEIGLWEQSDGGYTIHDYHDYNPTRKEVEEQREKTSQERSKAGTKGAESRWQTDSKPMANELQNDSPVPVPVPVPVPAPVPAPVPQKPSCANAQKREPTARDIAIAHLEKVFSQNTGLPLPPRSTVAEKKASAKRWWNPLWSIYDVSSGADIERAEKLITQTVLKMRNDNLTIASPQSIQQVSASIAANGNGHGASSGQTVSIAERAIQISRARKEATSGKSG